MMLQRWVSRKNSGNAVRYRVAACRKRLRIVRTTLRAQIYFEIDREFREFDVARNVVGCSLQQLPGFSVDSNLPRLALENKEREFAPTIAEGQEAEIA